jgi:hypothetical protein
MRKDYVYVSNGKNHDQKFSILWIYNFQMTNILVIISLYFAYTEAELR